jgi:hypothetical protein
MEKIKTNKELLLNLIRIIEGGVVLLLGYYLGDLAEWFTSVLPSVPKALFDFIILGLGILFFVLVDRFLCRWLQKHSSQDNKI